MAFGTMEVTPNPPPISSLAKRFRADVVSLYQRLRSALGSPGKGD